jgi:hypothetical protein
MKRDPSEAADRLLRAASAGGHVFMPARVQELQKLRRSPHPVVQPRPSPLLVGLFEEVAGRMDLDASHRYAVAVELMRAALCRAPLFLHFDLIAGGTGYDKQAGKPSNSWDHAHEFHDLAATQATQNGQVVR